MRHVPEGEALRRRLVEGVAAEVRSSRVLEALRTVPRHMFVPWTDIDTAYEDRPLSIGYDATISQPTVVGLMTEALELRGNEHILEVGTGSGYQAAVLSLLAREVDTIELVPELAARAAQTLAELTCANVHVHVGDGWQGLPDRAPFDAIVVTAAPDVVPATLIAQLVEGGRLVVPVGPATGHQRLERLRRRKGRLVREDLCVVRFVPLLHAPT